MLIAEELTLQQHFFGARVIGTLHEASVWLYGFTIGAAHRLPIESLFSVFENPQVLSLCTPNKMSRVVEIEVFGNELLVGD